MGFVMLPSPEVSPEEKDDILAIGSGSEDIDDDELGVTNPLGAATTNGIHCEGFPLTNGIVANTSTPLSSAFAPSCSDAALTYSDTPSGLGESTPGTEGIPTASPMEADTQEITTTPTLRAEASVASPLAATRSIHKKSVNYS